MNGRARTLLFQGLTDNVGQESPNARVMNEFIPISWTSRLALPEKPALREFAKLTNNFLILNS